MTTPAGTATAPSPSPSPSPIVTLRYGGEADVRHVADLFGRCSETTLSRRFHVPRTRLSERLLLAMLRPDDGWSVLAETGGRVVGMACAGPVSAHDLEVGLVVADAHQQRGTGSRLLAKIADEASDRGYRALLCLSQPDNDAVPPTIRRLGLPTETARGDGLVMTVVSLSSRT